MGVFDKVKKLADNAAQVVQQTSETVDYVKNSFQVEKDRKESSSEKSVKELKETSSAVGGIYNTQMESLIELSLSNGELTDKKRQILLRKAEALGIDLDEFEMNLELRVEAIRETAEKRRPLKTMSDASIQEFPETQFDEKEQIEEEEPELSLSNEFKQGVNNVKQDITQIKSQIEKSIPTVKSSLKSLRGDDEWFWLKVIFFPIWLPFRLLWKWLRSVVDNEWFWEKVIFFPIWFPFWLLCKIIIGIYKLTK